MHDAPQYASWVHTNTGRCRDIEAGTFIAAFKGNASGPGCLARLGRDYVVAAQTSRSALHFWTWHKVREPPSTRRLGCADEHKWHGD